MTASDGVTPAAQTAGGRSRVVPERRFVYLIEAMGLERVKIGSTDDPKRRLTILQVGSPVPLRLATVFKTDDADALERHFHKRFAGQRRLGEWFEINDVLRTIMDEEPFTVDDKIEIIMRPQPEPPKPDRVLVREQRPGESWNKFIKRAAAEWRPGTHMTLLPSGPYYS